jgi:hypothetical protein
MQASCLLPVPLRHDFVMLWPAMLWSSAMLWPAITERHCMPAYPLPCHAPASPVYLQVSTPVSPVYLQSISRCPRLSKYLPPTLTCALL